MHEGEGVALRRYVTMTGRAPNKLRQQWCSLITLNERRVCATSNGSVCHWCLFGRVAMVFADNPQRTKVLEEKKS